jgi:hypothetical protein
LPEPIVCTELRRPFGLLRSVRCGHPPAPGPGSSGVPIAIPQPAGTEPLFGGAVRRRPAPPGPDSADQAVRVELELAGEALDRPSSVNRTTAPSALVLTCVYRCGETWSARSGTETHAITNSASPGPSWRSCRRSGIKLSAGKPRSQSRESLSPVVSPHIEHAIGRLQRERAKDRLLGRGAAEPPSDRPPLRELRASPCVLGLLIGSNRPDSCLRPTAPCACAGSLLPVESDRTAAAALRNRILLDPQTADHDP